MLTWTSSCNFTLNTCVLLRGFERHERSVGKDCAPATSRRHYSDLPSAQSASQPASHPPQCLLFPLCPARRGLKKKKIRWEMQWDPECSPSVVYFHKNIPGVDSYSPVWKAESQCNFSRLRPRRGTPTVTLIWRMRLSFCTSTLETVAGQRGKGYMAC